MKALKKVPGKNKGLSKLPTSVRNKMGYMKKGGKVYQNGGKAPKGEIDLGGGSYLGMTLAEAEELNRRVEENYGKNPSDIRSGYRAIDRRLDEKEQYQREARARAGNKYYDGDGAGDARRTKAYNDQLEERIKAQMVGEKYDAYREKSKKENSEKMKKGGKVVKYQKGGRTVLPEVTVVGKKGAGLKERTVVGRGLSGEDYLNRRDELLAEYKNAWLTKNKRHPKSRIPSGDMSFINDKVRMQLIKEGVTERGVTNKKTKERLSPGMEEQYRERTARK
jgi:hypothetical protein